MILVATIIFLFGVAIGSFLNVVTYRLGTERSFGGRSACLSCRRALPWYELVPVLSFLYLRGRCHGCRAQISWQYPAVELLTGLLFLSLFLKLQDIFFADTLSFAAVFAFYAAIFCILIIITVYDLKHKVIPDALSFLLGLLALAGLFFLDTAGLVPHLPSLAQIFLPLTFALVFCLFWYFSQGTWMGLGDAKLSVGLGWLLGSAGMLAAVAVAFWTGAAVGIYLLLFSPKYGLKTEIPFAPFLIFGSILAFMFNLHLPAIF